jgi:hypothetical protein
MRALFGVELMELSVVFECWSAPPRGGRGAALLWNHKGPNRLKFDLFVI